MGSAYYTGMRNGTRFAAIVLVLLPLAIAAAQPAAPAASTSQLPPSVSSSQPLPPPAPAGQGQLVGTISDLIVKIIYPASDAIFYISTRTPASEGEWSELQ